MEPRDLLLALMARDGDNPHSLSVKLRGRIKQPQIYKFVTGAAKEPRRSTLQPLAEHYDVPIDAFYDATVAAGVAKRLRLDEDDSAGRLVVQEPGAAYQLSLTSNEFVIPQFEAGGGMGRGKLLLEDQPGLIKSWHVDENWLRLNVRNYTSVQNLCIVTGFGPSMKGMFNPGDPLLCDRGVRSVELDAVYFFRIEDHGFIKILQRIPTGKGVILRAKSKNTDYEPFDITPDMDFEVLAKVLTIWKSEQL